MSSNLKVNTILPSTGTSIGIGTAGGAVLLGATTTSNAEQFRIHTPDSGKAIIKLTNSTTGTGTGDGFEFGMNANEQIEFVNKENTDMFFATNNTERLRVDSSGRVLINTTTTYSSNQMLYVKGASPSNPYDGQAYLEGSETSGAINTGGTLLFGGHDGGTARTWGAIRTLKEDGTSGNYGSYMAFLTRPNGSAPTEKLRILSDGKILIGSTNQSNNARLGNELCIVGTEAYTGMSITNYPGTSPQHSPLLDFNRSRGTSDQSMTSVVAGDKIGELIFRGSNGSAFTDAVALRAYADSVSGSNVDGRYEISTSQAGTMAIRFRVNENGHITTPDNVIFSANGGPSDVTNGILVFANIVFQRGGTNYNTSNGVFTAPVTGIYHFMCNPYRYTSSDDSYIHLQRSTNNGSSWTNEIEVRAFTSGANGWNTLALSNLIDLNAGWQVRIGCTNRVHTNGTFTRFSGMLVG